MYSETVKQKLNMMYKKGCTHNWYDFFFATIILFSLGTVSFFFFPILNLWIAFYTLGILCLMAFLVFQEGVTDGDT